MAGLISNMPGGGGRRKTRVSGNPQMVLPGMERPGPLPGPVRNVKTKAKGMPTRLQAKPVRMSTGQTLAPKMSADYITGGANVAGKKMTPKGAEAGKGILNKMGKMSRGSKIGIGLGLGVAAAVTMNRRGPGASSGRQSIYRC